MNSGNEIIPDVGMTADQIYFWWKCMRKHSYPTKDAATQVIIEHDDLGRLNSYQCEYCENWHNGQTATKSHVGLSKLRSNWKKRDTKPKLETVRIYWENPKQMSLTFWDDFEKDA